MLKIFADLLMHGEIKIERGSFVVLGQRLLMSPMPFFLELTKNVLNDPKKSIELYELCKKALVHNFSVPLAKKYGLTGLKLVDTLQKFGEIGGWGEIDMLDYDETNKRAIVRINNTPIGSYLRNTNSKPVDHIVRGFMAGSASGVFNKDMDYVEVKCVAKGDPYCEFIAKEKAEFLKEDSALIHEQISSTVTDFGNLG